MTHIVHIEIDDQNLPVPTPEIEQERRVAMFDLLEQNNFGFAGARPARYCSRAVPRASFN